jgi:D-tyrosyl-tRNA(Tyr) deacylase
MRVIIQRVSEAQVTVNGEAIAAIGKGLLLLLGIEDADNEEDVDWLCGKIARLRIFADQDDLMNLDVVKSGGELLVVSQFTLHAGTKKGNRPSFIKAARPEKAIPLYEKFVERLSQITSKKVQTGAFGTMMQVSLVNDGPVTIFIDSKNKE